MEQGGGAVALEGWRVGGCLRHTPDGCCYISSRVSARLSDEGVVALAEALVGDR